MSDDKDCKLFIGNITYNTRDDELRDIFSKHGNVKECRIATDGNTGRSRGFAFVTMETPEDAQRCVDNVTGMDVDGRTIKVEISHGMRTSGGGGGRGGGRDRGFDRRDDRGYDRRDDRDRGGRDRDYGRDRDAGRDWGRDRDAPRDRDFGRDRDNGGRRDRDRSPYGGRRENNREFDRRSRSRDGGRGDRDAGADRERRDRSRDR